MIRDHCSLTWYPNLIFMISMILFVSGVLYLGQISIKAIDATNTSSNTATSTDPSLVFFLTNPTGNFNATGTISSLVLNTISGNTATNSQYILSGDWNILASNGNITDFGANFTMVLDNGTNRHTHSITNFTSNVVAPLILDIHGTTFTGESDITINDDVIWRAVQTTVTISRQDTLSITFNHDTVNMHFQNQPIYGIVFSIQEYEEQQQQPQ